MSQGCSSVQQAGQERDLGALIDETTTAMETLRVALADLKRKVLTDDDGTGGRNA